MQSYHGFEGDDDSYVSVSDMTKKWKCSKKIGMGKKLDKVGQVLLISAAAMV